MVLYNILILYKNQKNVDKEKNIILWNANIIKNKAFDKKNTFNFDFISEEFTKKKEEYRIEKENKEKEKQEKEMQYKNDEINKNKQKIYFIKYK